MTGLVHHPYGPRLYLGGHRVHHGSAALLIGAAAFATHHPRIALGALALVAHDARDFPWRDCDNHPPREGELR